MLNINSSLCFGKNSHLSFAIDRGSELRTLVYVTLVTAIWPFESQIYDTIMFIAGQTAIRQEDLARATSRSARSTPMPAYKLQLYYITNGKCVTRDPSASEADVFSRQDLKSFIKILFGLQSFLSIMNANLNRKRRLSVTDEVAQSSRDTQKRDFLYECVPAKVRKLAFDSKVSSHFQRISFEVLFFEFLFVCSQSLPFLKLRSFISFCSRTGP